MWRECWPMAVGALWEEAAHTVLLPASEGTAWWWDGRERACELAAASPLRHEELAVQHQHRVWSSTGEGWSRPWLGGWLLGSPSEAAAAARGTVRAGPAHHASGPMGSLGFSP